MTRVTAVWVLSLGPGFGACLPVQGDGIRGADLALVIPAFGRVMGQVLSPAPLAGAQRNFTKGELVRIARRLNLPDAGATGWPDVVCFAFTLAPLDTAQVEKAIRLSLARDVAFELIEHSQFPVPTGEIRFAGVSLRPDRPDGSRLLSGSVVYAAGRKAPIWVRVRSLVKPVGLLAAVELRPGVSFDDSHFTASELGDSPAVDAVASAAELAGMTPRRVIPAGTPLRLSMFTRTREIRPGETVAVKVRSGAANLTFDSTAESGGYLGDLIMLRNPVSGQKFRARVEGRLQASVVVPGRDN